VRLRLRSDVPIGTCLSGGLDSSSIVTTVAELRMGEQEAGHAQAPRLGFHARFPAHGIDESAYAELVARKASIRLIHTTPAGVPLLRSVLPVIRAQGEPYASASIDAQYAVMAAAHAERIKVLLDGQGADELLGGYDLYRGVRTAGLLLSGHPRDAARELRAQVARGPASASSAMLRRSMPPCLVAASRYPRCLRRPVRHPRTGPLAGETAMRTRREPGTRGDPPLVRFSAEGLRPPALRGPQQHGVRHRARVPFLDVRLVELGVRLPTGSGWSGVIRRSCVVRSGRLPAPLRIGATSWGSRPRSGPALDMQRWPICSGRADRAPALVAPDEVERVLAEARWRRSRITWRLFIVGPGCGCA
jgi:asparagine synthase (glutamine-hydrolysing)